MQPTKTELRIVSGRLRGRKVSCTVREDLRPTPLMVREALFSILGNAVPGRVFFDLFAGTGIHGMEAISRGAASAVFVEFDAKSVSAIGDYVKRFDIAETSVVQRGDVYRWAERWFAPPEPVNLFLSPPFADLTERFDRFIELVTILDRKAAADSVISVQAEDGFDFARLPGTDWDVRQYGRNYLAIRVKESVDTRAETTAVEPVPQRL